MTLVRALCCCAVATTIATAQQPPAPTRPTRPRTIAEDLQLFSQVLNQIRVNHPDSIDMHAALLSAVEGLVRAADPHSYVIPSVRLDSARREAWLAGKLQPVLIDFRFVQGAPLVAALAPGSRIARMDILVGDELIEIAGAPVQARSPEELAYTLAGQKDSRVRLRFERRRADGSIIQLERNVPREHPDEVTAVPVAMMLDGLTGYVRLTTFAGSRVADDLSAKLTRLTSLGMQRLVVDLRDNGGGRLDQATEIASAFLPRGAVIYSVASPKRELVDTGRVSRSLWRTERRLPLVVLVNAGTASASEVLAGALQDHDRAIVVGHTTFGKALVMQRVPLSDGSLFVLVVGRVSTPCGRVVQRDYRGITQRHYLRTAGAAQDTAGRPSCRTASGRTLYGGGGIVPDVALVDDATPPWLSRLGEGDVLLTWSAGYVTEHQNDLQDEGRFASSALPGNYIADVRAFAATRGIAIPTDSASTDLLERTARRSIAYAKWGYEGYYRVLTLTDAAVASAVRAFAQ